MYNVHCTYSNHNPVVLKEMSSWTTLAIHICIFKEICITNHHDNNTCTYIIIIHTYINYNKYIFALYIFGQKCCLYPFKYDILKLSKTTSPALKTIRI